MIKNDDRVSTWQMFIISISAMNAIEVLIFPRELAIDVGPDGWIPLLGGHLAAAVGLLVIIKLGLMYPEETFADYTPRIVGRYLGFGFVSLAVVFWILVTARITREFGDFIKMGILNDTPIEIIILALLVVSVYLVRHGIEPIARALEILFPIFMAIFGFLFVLVFTEADFSNLRPFFQSDIPSLAMASLDTAIGLEGKEVIIMLLPFMAVSKDAYKASFGALGLNLVLRLVLFAMTIAAFGTELTKTLVYPVQALSASPTIPGAFFGRLDVIFISLWVTIAFSSVVVFYYLAALALSRLLKFREHSFMVLPYLPVIFLLSLIPQNVVQIEEFSDVVSLLFGTLAYGIPLVLLITSYIRGTHKQPSPGRGR